jgi:hypothetical protein
MENLCFFTIGSKFKQHTVFLAGLFGEMVRALAHAPVCHVQGIFKHGRATSPLSNQSLNAGLWKACNGLESIKIDQEYED